MRLSGNGIHVFQAENAGVISIFTEALALFMRDTEATKSTPCRLGIPTYFPVDTTFLKFQPAFINFYHFFSLREGMPWEKQLN